MRIRWIGAVLTASQLLGVASAGDLPGPKHARTRPACLAGIPDARYQYGPQSPTELAISRTGILLRDRTVEIEAALAAELLATIESDFRSENSIRRQTTGEGVVLEQRAGEVLETPRGIRERSSEALRRELPGPPIGLWDRLGLGRRSVDEFPPPLDLNATRLDRERFTSVRPAPTVARRTVVDLYQLERAAISVGHCHISQVALQIHDNGMWILSLRADQNPLPPPGAVPIYNPTLHIKRNLFHVKLRCLGAYREPVAEFVPSLGKPVLAELSPCPFWVENGQPRFVRTGRVDPWLQEHFADIDRVEVEFFFR
ncbi:MAG: hypothetical protein R3C99_09335 [Pirellulaceae bacterium]|nr:hypothetical protein [Planctomycetales bacterium]